jgi:4a-hydroxytetrahydrobiopterin dehydratase
MPRLLSADEVAAALTGLSGWSGDTTGIRRTVEAPSFPAGIGLVGRVAEVAEERDHHPDIDIRWRSVTFALSTHSEGGVTDLDVDLAGTIDAFAAAF